MTATEARDIMRFAHIEGMPRDEGFKPIISYINARITHKAAIGWNSLVVYFRQSAEVVEQVEEHYKARGYKTRKHGQYALRIEW